MGKVILRIFDGIAKVLAFVLVSLGLWLPAVFSVVFFIVCGVKHISFSGLTAGLYWGGLIVTAIAGFTLSMYVRSRKKAKAGGVVKAKKSKRESEQTERIDNQYAGNYAAPPPVYPQQSYAPPPLPYPQQNPYGYAQSYAPPPPPQGYAQQSYAQQPVQNYAPPQQQPTQRNDTSDLDRKYFSDYSSPERYERTASLDEGSVQQAYGKTMSKTEQRVADSRFDSEELWRRLSGTDVPDEQPLVFRTRKDPDLYVYEYSDRYQYWRRTRTGMVFENTEYKKEKATK